MTACPINFKKGRKVRQKKEKEMKGKGRRKGRKSR
jgi:hypothetical protein